MKKSHHFDIVKILIALCFVYNHLLVPSCCLMPGGRKFTSLKASSIGVGIQNTPTRSCRNGSSNIGSGIHTISSLLTIPPLFHFPHPKIPVWSVMGFEALFLSFLLSALGLQYINIYKLNFHVVDPYLVSFIVVFLSRRVTWMVFKQILASEIFYTVKYVATMLIKAVLLCTFIVATLWLLWKLFQHNSIQNYLFLIYPVFMYLCAFGFTLDPQGNKVMFKLSPHTEILQPLTITKLTDKKTLSNGEMKQELLTTLNTPCNLPPDAVRYEAECLRTDFNWRVKQVLFQSLVSAYYVGFIPMRFSEQFYIYYDLWWALQQALFIWLSSLIMLMIYMLPINYCDALHKCATHLGGWERYPWGHRDTPHIWSPLTVWPQGVLVRYNKTLYRGLGVHNVAVPSDPHHSRFFFMFESPLRLLNWMAGTLLVLVFYQLFLITRCSFWHQLLSIIGMLLFNYVTLYRVLRDRWALQGVVKERETNQNDDSD
ncbi:transmembrane protein 39A [Exaiptasia diaphana]|uniref:Transmembrane protein 39A n=1 Tax=Exaiptasia diaphana TaxID=2652724 RepID=A0A913Y474_EXADI|nr:transmembrane protein 39A [Exaiptasia diaphana]KXJ22790.1 Transmembrane protein 39A [Exaiptasia diaphana]